MTADADVLDVPAAPTAANVIPFPVTQDPAGPEALAGLRVEAAVAAAVADALLRNAEAALAAAAARRPGPWVGPRPEDEVRLTVLCHHARDLAEHLAAVCARADAACRARARPANDPGPCAGPGGAA